MRRLMGVLLVLLSACGGAVAPAPTAQDSGPIGLGVAEIARGEAASQEAVIIAPVYQTADGPRLASALSVVDGVVPLDQSLTVATEAITLNSGADYAVLRIVGRVAESQGAPLVIASSVKPLTPVTATLATVQTNSATYIGQVVALPGTLIVNDAEALLVAQVGPGGVPLAAAAQIKIMQPFNDPALFARLPNASGNTRFGEVVAVGLLQRKSLQLFWIQLP